MLETQVNGIKYFEDNPFIRSEKIKLIYEILNVRNTHNIEF